LVVFKPNIQSKIANCGFLSIASLIAFCHFGYSEQEVKVWSWTKGMARLLSMAMGVRSVG
jgi:hypothetical protein